MRSEAPEADLFSAEPSEPDAEASGDKLLRHLREWHRQLSDQIVTASRQLQRMIVKRQDGSPEASELRVQIEAWQAKRAEVERDIQAESAVAKTLAEPVPAPAEEASTGLVKVRHPNRDFFRGRVRLRSQRRRCEHGSSHLHLVYQNRSKHLEVE